MKWSGNVLIVRNEKLKVLGLDVSLLIWKALDVIMISVRLCFVMAKVKGDLTLSSCLLKYRQGAILWHTSSLHPSATLKHVGRPHVTSMPLKHRRDAFLMCHPAFIFCTVLSVVPHICKRCLLSSCLSPSFSTLFLQGLFVSTRNAIRWGGTHPLKLAFSWLCHFDWKSVWVIFSHQYIRKYVHVCGTWVPFVST